MKRTNSMFLAKYFTCIDHSALYPLNNWDQDHGYMLKMSPFVACFLKWIFNW
jgi:hypothetical protein